MMFTCLAVAVLVAGIIWLYKRLYAGETWEKYGVKQVKIGLFQSFNITSLLNEHGDTIGLKRGGQMVLVTRDLNLLKQVMVKDFNYFVDRASTVISRSPIAKALFFLEGRDWKRVRQIMSPSFSTGKVKHTVTTVQERAQKLSQVLKDLASKDKLLPVKYVTGQYTSEIIARMAFGLDTNCLGGEDDEFTYFAKTMFKSRNRLMSILMVIIVRYRWLQILLVKVLNITLFDSLSSESNEYFNAILHKSKQDRLGKMQANETVPADFFQSLLDARLASNRFLQDKDNDSEDYDEHFHSRDKGNDPSWNLLPGTLSDDEVVAQSMLIIFAGFETTATTLQMCLYMLAKHPYIQERVYAEIIDVVRHDTPTREELTQLLYMDQFINETLRLFPPVSMVTRKALVSRHYGDVTVPTGTSVMIPISAILKDPRHFPDPDVFDPDRFSEENKRTRDPLSFIPFGSGPRQCLGMRLAYLELKIALVHVMRKVNFEMNDKTEPKYGEDIAVKNGGLLALAKPMQLAMVPRQS